MKLLRSYPSVVPPGRNHVVDMIPKLLVDDYDLAGPIAEVNDDLILLEWDIAVGKEDLELFIAQARQVPERVLVAPYRLYADSEQWQAWRISGEVFLEPRDVWAHRVMTGAQAARFVHPDDPAADMFSFGMIYFPHKLIRGFLDAMLPGWHFDDMTFSGWHQAAVGHPAPIAWDVRPVHLHYELPEIDP